MRETINQTGTPVTVEWTGNTEQRYGQTWYEFKILTGYKKGKIAWSGRPPSQPMRAKVRDEPIIRSV